MKYSLVIFDVDGTLAEKYTLHLLPRVSDFFRLVFQQDCPERPRVAIATNQGGVGMRYWMERDHFGEPEQYPTEESIAARMSELVRVLGGGEDLPVYTSFRFRDKKGHWSPVPRGRAEDPRWSDEWRKPNPGMLIQSMQDAGVGPQETLFVGDSVDDRDAAHAAGCAFMEAGQFFSQDWTTCADLERMGD